MPDALNFIRTVATIMVFNQHMQQIKTAELVWVYPVGVGFLFRSCAWAGVWIFFILSGYLAGKGFASGRYEMKPRGVLAYYKNRLLKTWLPTVIFIFAEMLISHPAELKTSGLTLIFELITCTFNGNGGYSGMGHTWYVFTLMWMYLAAPLICLLMQGLRTVCRRHKRLKPVMMIIPVVIAVFGLCFRVVAFRFKLDWYSEVYTPPYGNADLFLSGLCLSYFLSEVDLKGRRLSMVLRATAVAAFLGFIAYNSFCYMISSVGLFDVNVYRYVFPTGYVLILLFYLFAFETGPKQKKDRVNTKAIVKNPLRLIDAFAGVSFGAYLFHMEVKNKLLEMFVTADTVKRYVPFFILAIAISSLFGWIYSKGVNTLISNCDKLVSGAFEQLKNKRKKQTGPEETTA